MPLTCPLCLARVEAQQLVHFCMLHEPDPNNVNTGCNKCSERHPLDVGSFVSHTGCKSQNPFVERFRSAQAATSATDPGPHEQESGPINPDGEALGDEGVRVSHWELAMLARAARLHANRSEMWFPYPLLQAVSSPRDLSDFGSCRIKLVGAREVGKTTLASMALKPESYREDDVPGYSLSSFVYATPTAGGGSPEEPFLEALHLTNVFDGSPSTTQQRLRPTLIRTQSVRAAFVALPRPAAGARSRGTTWKLKDLFVNTAQPRRKPYAAAVIFYDFAGEESEAAINYLAHAQHNQFADVIAVAIDATDISCFGIQAPPSKPNSLKAALKQLQSIQPGHRTRICLIVTHMDSIRNMAPKAGPVVPPALPKDPDHARRLICDWLKASENIDTPDRALALELSTRGVPTFLLWIENLGGAENIARARGFVNWLNWCFGNGFPTGR